MDELSIFGIDIYILVLFEFDLKSQCHIKIRFAVIIYCLIFFEFGVFSISN